MATAARSLAATLWRCPRLPAAADRRGPARGSARRRGALLSSAARGWPRGPPSARSAWRAAASSGAERSAANGSWWRASSGTRIEPVDRRRGARAGAAPAAGDRGRRRGPPRSRPAARRCRRRGGPPAAARRAPAGGRRGCRRGWSPAARSRRRSRPVRPPRRRSGRRAAPRRGRAPGGSFPARRRRAPGGGEGGSGVGELVAQIPLLDLEAVEVAGRRRALGGRQGGIEQAPLYGRDLFEHRAPLLPQRDRGGGHGMGGFEGVDQRAGAQPLRDLEGLLEALRPSLFQGGVDQAAGEPVIVLGPGGEGSGLSGRSCLLVAQRLDGVEHRARIRDGLLAATRGQAQRASARARRRPWTRDPAPGGRARASGRSTLLRLRAGSVAARKRARPSRQ